MNTYEDVLADVLDNGEHKPDRTGTGTRSVFGRTIRYDLSQGFPLITTKKVHFKSIVGELLWFLSGSTNANDLKERYGVSIWDEWAGKDGELGPVYGHQWRQWHDRDNSEGIDQIKRVIESIKDDPHSRRHIVSAWNVADIRHMALAPCHMLFQFYVSADGKRLSCRVDQRSADMFLGVPFNLASYALLTHMVAAQTGLDVGDLVWQAGDVHVYENHVDQVTEQLGRTPRTLPSLMLTPAPSINDYTPHHIHLDFYDPHPAIAAPVAV